MCVVKVNGVLGFVLHLSRIMGISLISLKRCENGYDASFSYATTLYGYFSLTLINLLGIIGFILEVISQKIFPTGSLIDLALTIIFCAVFFCNGITTTKSMLKHLAILLKINSKLNYSIKKPRVLKKKHIVLCLGGCTFFVFLTAMTFIQSVLTAENLSDYIYLSLAYSNLKIVVLETLMITLKYKLYEALKNIRGELENHLRLVKFEQPTVVSTQKYIRKIANVYFAICKVINEMNEGDGTFYIFLITSNIFNTVYVTCDVIYRITSDSTTFIIVYDFLWISSFVIRFCVIVEPCHHIVEEAGKIQVILSQLNCHTTAVGKPCSWEWDLILNQLYLLEPSFTPFGMLTLDRTLFTTIISVTTTYLTIVIPHAKAIYKNIMFI